MGVLAAPAVLVYVLLTDPRALLRPRFIIVAALVVAVGTSVNLFIPIRAHLDPYLNQGEATTWPALKAVLARDQFGEQREHADDLRRIEAVRLGIDRAERALELSAAQHDRHAALARTPDGEVARVIANAVLLLE